MRRALALLVLGALVLGVVYYSKYHPGRLPGLRGGQLGPVGTKLGEVGQTVSEKFRATRVGGAVKTALELNRNLNAYAIDVDAHQDGTVVLSGEVPTTEVRDSAARVAASVPDVARVDNQLHVNASLAPPAGEGRSLGESFDDRALEAKVKLAFSLSRDMKGSDVAVSSFRREVTLSGTVAGDAQRQVALRIAQDIPQVAAVKDGLQAAGAAVSATPSPTSGPAMVAASGTSGADGTDPVRAAEAALAANANLAPFVLKVHMQGGRLVLTGRVRTGAEKDLAGVVARDAASAAVQNKVIVQP